MQEVLGAVGVEVHRGESVDFFRCEEMKIRQLGLQVVQKIWVGSLLQERSIVIRLKGLLDLIRVVDEVQDKRLGLPGRYAIEPRERLHGIDSPELLIDVHRVEQRLIKSRLK